MNVAGVLVFAVNMLLAPIFLVALFAVATVALVEMDSYVKVSHSQNKICLNTTMSCHLIPQALPCPRLIISNHAYHV